MGVNQVRAEQIRVWTETSQAAKARRAFASHLPDCEQCCHWFFDGSALNEPQTVLCPEGRVAYNDH